ncbi:hypothetical protein Clacol_004527 [Clathrus columnatus]|uniref:Uncharacterized protein n=1 Tax=Clathrus columnatus TaxID=1419009 RepID=A0AAV5ABA0_9AGAM|nr:hypothetical protein Clacol_004527 [Clathrus columnatus]
MKNSSSGSTKSALQNYEDNEAARESREIIFPETHPSRLVRFREHLFTDVDPDQSSLPLACYCFMTGFIDALTFTAVSLSLSLARLFAISEVPGPHFRVVDRQSLTSILSFLCGAFIGRIGDKMGAKSRIWLFLGTVIQAMFTLAAAILLLKGRQSSFSTGGPSWTNVEGYFALGLASASMGLQGIMGKRVNTQFATTIVLTTVWCELMAEPALFIPKLVRSRDLKVLAVSALFFGGFVGRALIDKIGDAATFGIGTALRMLIALMWLWVPAKVKALPIQH